MTEYFKIGKIVATFGYKGEVVVKHHLGKKSSFKGLKAIFLEERKDSFIPWFLESSSAKDDTETFVKIEGINTKEEANKLTQKEVWLPDEDFKKMSASSSPLNLLGYAIVEGEKVLGTILEIIEQPHQLLCKIELNGNEVLIPLHEKTIKKIDRRNKKIIVELPAGLLEIYQ